MMTLEERFEASKVPISTNLRAQVYSGASIPLVGIKRSEKVIANPIWVNPHDTEGKYYVEYMDDHPSYKDIYVRKPISKMLQKAAESLPDDWILVIKSGHRPLAVQSMLFDHIKADLKTKFKVSSEDELNDLTRKYVADPKVKMPAHCCGAAVDVDVFNMTSNSLVDFGSPINFESDISQLHTSLINPTQHKNRMILLIAMLHAGFASDYHEWWHYSYGDSQWAVFYKQNEPLFDLIEYT